MRLNNLKIEVHPWMFSNGRKEIRMIVETDLERYEVREVLEDEHFDALFDRVVEKAVFQLKEAIKKTEEKIS